MIDLRKERMRGMRVATALLRKELDDASIEDIKVFVHDGRAPRFEAALVENLNDMTRNTSDQNPPLGYLLGRFGLLAAPRILAKTADERAQRDFLLAEAHRQHALACVHRRYIDEGRDSVAKAKALYDKRSVAPLVTFQLTLLEMSEAWIEFYSDEIDKGLGKIQSCFNTLRDRFHDDLRYTVARNWYGSMLLQLDRNREASEEWVGLLKFANENNQPALLGSVLHNSAGAFLRLGNDCPRDWTNLSETLLQKWLGGQAPRTKYLLVEELKNQGRKAEAISVLYMIRAEFEADDQDVVAAATVRAIVQELIPLGRRSEAEMIGWPAVEMLERYGMTLEARRIRELLSTPPGARVAVR